MTYLGLNHDAQIVTIIGSALKVFGFQGIVNKKQRMNCSKAELIHEQQRKADGYSVLNLSSVAHQVKGIDCDFIDVRGELVSIKLQDCCLEPLFTSNDTRPIL